ncbi:tripartite tricarboxylate transporter TctB family protein [Alsobacter soli]|uniref:Tripartite tricarboxylate transporter TctB family protein n=1 Tax=Alsobacter soli TaxID=2109933 RepID=A0A2T1HWT1_9HYPH|nr:tripartite tricarboxylate transporter TctB family protein [Alsobacter soli]PSC06050.1 tripartite tricarboxylate transporter TctB family protein [Alsobacter soli]
MSNPIEPRERTVSVRLMELVVAGMFMAAALLVMTDNWRIGARWADDGPQAGYFPFYVGLIMLIASSVTFVANLMVKEGRPSNFVARSELTRVLQVLVPAAVFVIAIGYLGIYVSAALFIAAFMAWLGRYPAHRIAPVAILVPLALFFMFEVWFLVPLPKGPLESWLGY